jgi:hypothetical protein
VELSREQAKQVGGVIAVAATAAVVGAVATSIVASSVGGTAGGGAGGSAANPAQLIAVVQTAHMMNSLQTFDHTDSGGAYKGYTSALAPIALQGPSPMDSGVEDCFPDSYPKESNSSSETLLDSLDDANGGIDLDASLISPEAREALAGIPVVRHATWTVSLYIVCTVVSLILMPCLGKKTTAKFFNKIVVLTMAMGE